jgi:hypothetical protein
MSSPPDLPPVAPYGFDGSPPPPPPPDRRASGNRWVVAVVAGLAAVVVLVALVMLADGGGSSSADASPAAVADRFVAAVNRGDRRAAEELLCEDATMLRSVDELVAGDAQLRLEVELSESQIVPQGPVRGTYQGEAAAGSIRVLQRRDPGELITDPDAPWCVSAFDIADPLPVG